MLWSVDKETRNADGLGCLCQRYKRDENVGCNKIGSCIRKTL